MVKYLKSLAQKKFYLCVLIMALPFEASFASASVKDVHNMVYICVNLHRVQKDYALVGMGVRYDNPEKDLKETILKIEQEFSEIIDDHHLDQKLEAQIVAIAQDWKKIRVIAETKPDKAKMEALHDAVEALTNRCLKAANALASDSQVEGEKYVVESVEMGMEVQRLAALYLMRAWGIQRDDYFSEVRHVLEEFEGFYHDLKGVDERFVPAATKVKLDQIEKDFLLFENLAESKKGRFTPSLAQRSANKLFEKINETTEEIMAQVER